MSESEDGDEPLLSPLASDQLLLLTEIGQVLADSGDWPVFDYVEWRLDQHDLDANAVIPRLPRMSSGPFSYGLLYGDPSRSGQLRPDDRAILTAAGLERLPHALAEVRDLAARYIEMLSGLAEHHMAWPRSPHAVAKPEIALVDVFDGINLEEPGHARCVA